MLQALRRRLERDEEGFTLIELMVVVLIIAILLAIAIPTFLGARTKAQDRAAQSNLRNALTAEKTIYVDNQAYLVDTPVLPATVGPVTGVEPSLKYGLGIAPATTGIVYLTVGDTGATVCVADKSASGAFFAIVDASTGTAAGTHYFGTSKAFSLLAACDAATGVSGASSF
jgi:type IV pilus assembly protein PilA